MIGLNHVCVLSFLLCTGCAFDDSSEDKPDQAAATTTISSNDNGKTLKIKTGRSILVHLPVQRGTGYSWQPFNTENQSLYVVKEETDSSATAVQPGSKELQAFRLYFKQAGATDVVFQYRRPWDAKSPPANTFHVKIDAQK